MFGTDKVRIMCFECGSEDVVIDAHVVWNYETQSFEVDWLSAESECKNCDCMEWHEVKDKP